MSLSSLIAYMRRHAAVARSGTVAALPLYISCDPVFPRFIHLCQSCSSVGSDSILPFIHPAVFIPPSDPVARRICISVSEGQTSFSSTDRTFSSRSTTPDPFSRRGFYLQSAGAVAVSSCTD
ncbi:hypothetical protein CRENBAI_006121 [Crenichthys baileyi]|uniref:Uncharacterized protein n=1 Tax=Crenichthys baileyi TaxID=28760 RepID=A0AAV9RUT5_9TELE